MLFLGSSETIGSVSDRFEPISKKHRIYRHIGRSRPGEVEFPRGTSDAGRSARQGVTATNGAATARLRRAIAASVAGRLCASLRPDQRQARGPLLLRVGGPLSEGCLRRGHPGYASHGAGRVARQAEISNRSAPSRITHSVTLTGAHVKRDGRSIAVSVTARPVESDGKRLFLVSFVDDLTPEPRPVTAC